MNRQRNTLLVIIIIVVFSIIKLIAFVRQDHIINRPDGNLSFRNTDHLILTKHAKCRMDCRHITMDEIKEILHAGSENYTKSGEGSKGDETYALEGYSTEHQHIRVVVAPKSNGNVIITCIDLDKEWPCNCN